MIEELKKKLSFLKKKKEDKKEKDKKNTIPKDILDKLPPGVKIKKIEVGPKQIIRFIKPNSFI